MKCVGCGCTDTSACMGVDGIPCHWALRSPPTCSTCDDMENLRVAATLLRLHADIFSVTTTCKQGRTNARVLRLLSRRLDGIRRKIAHGASR